MSSKDSDSISNSQVDIYGELPACFLELKIRSAPEPCPQEATLSGAGVSLTAEVHR